MKIALFGDVSAREALQAAGHALFEVNVTAAADLAGRAQAGPQALQSLRGLGLGALLDRDGAGLLLAPQGAGQGMSLLHELLNVPLVSEFTRPVPDALAPLTPEVYWPCLASRRWHKVVADPDHAAELTRLGVPNVIHQAAGAGARRETAGPPRMVVEYAGDVSDVLGPGRAHLGTTLRPVLAALDASESAAACFSDVYSGPASPSEDRQAYYAARRVYTAARSARRDRWLLALKRALGDRFRIAGKGWKQAYGLDEASADAGHGPALVNLAFAAPDSERRIEAGVLAAAAAGGLVLAHRALRIEDCFEIGVEADVFASAEEMIEKCRYYLDHPDDARRIAEAGRRRCLREHLMAHRLAALAAADPALRELAKAAAAPARPVNDGREALVAATSY